MYFILTIYGTCNCSSRVVCFVLTLVGLLSDVCVFLPSMTVFCSSLISCFTGMVVRYFLNDLVMVLVAPIITGITFGFTFCMR